MANKLTVKVATVPANVQARHVPCASCETWVWVEPDETVAALNDRAQSPLCRSCATSSAKFLEARLRRRYGADLEVVPLDPRLGATLPQRVKAAPYDARLTRQMTNYRLG